MTLIPARPRQSLNTVAFLPLLVFSRDVKHWCQSFQRDLKRGLCRRRGLVLEAPVPERSIVISVPWGVAITPETAWEALAQAEGAGSSKRTLALKGTSACKEGCVGWEGNGREGCLGWGRPECARSHSGKHAEDGGGWVYIRSRVSRSFTILQVQMRTSS